MNNNHTTMSILLIGAGVIGTVYGAELSAAGHSVSVYAHGKRTERIKKRGLIIKDLTTEVLLHQAVQVVDDPSTVAYDLVLVAIREDHLTSVFPTIKQLLGEPTILFFGNNPSGYSALPKDLGRTIALGFPGIGGAMNGDVVEYIRISQQPTAIQTNTDSSTLLLADTLRSRGFKVNSVSDMDGYLLYHAVFIASISAALYRCDTDPAKLAGDHATLSLMCQAIEEGFRVLRSQGLGGEPRNLRILHVPLLRQFAIWYWGHAFRSSLGEFEFAAHARSARNEMDELAQAVVATTSNSPTPHNHLLQLLNLKG